MTRKFRPRYGASRRDGIGVASAAAGKSDIGASDAYLSSTELAEYPTSENVPLAISAQVVSYNLPGDDGNLKLNSTILAEMYQGKITRWNDPAIRALNPGASLPSLRVIPIHRSQGSGGTFLFTSYLSQPGSNWANSVGFSTGVAWPPVAGAISLIDGSSPGGYPMVNYEYAIVSTRQPTAGKAATIKALLNWILTHGSSSVYLGKVGFQPLPSQVATIADALIAKIG